MGPAGRAAAIEVGEGAGEFQHPVITARGEAQPLGGVAHERQPRRVRVRDLLDDAGRSAGVADNALEFEFGVAGELDLAGRADAGGDLGRTLPRGRNS